MNHVVQDLAVIHAAVGHLHGHLAAAAAVPGAQPQGVAPDPAFAALQADVAALVAGVQGLAAQMAALQAQQAPLAALPAQMAALQAQQAPLAALPAQMVALQAQQAPLAALPAQMAALLALVIVESAKAHNASAGEGLAFPYRPVPNAAGVLPPANLPAINNRTNVTNLTGAASSQPGQFRCSKLCCRNLPPFGGSDIPRRLTEAPCHLGTYSVLTARARCLSISQARKQWRIWGSTEWPPRRSRTLWRTGSVRWPVCWDFG